MDSSEHRDGDAAIETALRSEPMRRVSSGFFGRMRQRLAIVALIKREERWFRQNATAAGVFLLAVLVVLGLAYVASIPSRLAWYVPGGMGIIDYLKSEMFLSMPVLVTLLALAFVVSFGAAVFAFMRPTERANQKSRKSIFW